MVHQARTVLERSRSRSTERSKKRNTSGSGMAGRPPPRRERGGARSRRRSRPQHRLRGARRKPCRVPDGMVHENATAGQRGRRDDRESSTSISPGRNWARLLVWIAAALIVSTRQQWDSTLGFPGEGPNNAPEGWRRTSAPVDGTCLCGKPYLRKNTGYLHESGVFACRKTCTNLTEAQTLPPRHSIDCLDDSQMSMQIEDTQVDAPGSSTDLWESTVSAPSMTDTPAATTPLHRQPRHLVLRLRPCLFFRLTRVLTWEVWMMVMCNTNLSTGPSARLMECGARVATRNGAMVDASGSAKRAASASARCANRQLYSAKHREDCVYKTKHAEKVCRTF